MTYHSKTEIVVKRGTLMNYDKDKFSCEDAIRSKRGNLTLGKDSLEGGMLSSLNLEFKRKLKESNTLAYLSISIDVI